MDEPDVVVAIVDQHVTVLSHVVSQQELTDVFRRRPWCRHRTDGSVCCILWSGREGEGETVVK